MQKNKDRKIFSWWNKIISYKIRLFIWMLSMRSILRKLMKAKLIKLFKIKIEKLMELSKKMLVSKINSIIYSEREDPCLNKIKKLIKIWKISKIIFKNLLGERYPSWNLLYQIAANYPKALKNSLVQRINPKRKYLLNRVNTFSKILLEKLRSSKKQYKTHPTRSGLAFRFNHSNSYHPLKTQS